MALLGWVDTHKKYTEIEWEIETVDYSSKNMLVTSQFSSEIRASSSAEAISKATGGISGNVYGASAKADYSTELKVNGQITYVYTVSGSVQESYTQYFDREEKVVYTYSIYELVDQNGRVYDVDYRGRFIEKSHTGLYRLVESRTAAN